MSKVVEQTLLNTENLAKDYHLGKAVVHALGG